jgi:hypothetical protein
VPSLFCRSAVKIDWGNAWYWNVRSHECYFEENLALSAVEIEHYELIALPMKLEELNAAHMRAASRPLCQIKIKAIVAKNEKERPLGGRRGA